MINSNLVNLPSVLNKKTIQVYEQATSRARVQFLRASAPFLEQEILSMITSGISPVAGKGRFKGYSESYKSVIQGKLSFRTNRYTGQVYTIVPQLKVDKVRFAKKRIRPVNMTLSGAMLDSLRVKVYGDRVEASFKSEIAQYHNNLGAGKSRVIRRLLPDRKGEQFSEVIMANMRKIMTDFIQLEIDGQRF